MARTYKQPPKQHLLRLPVLIEDTTFYSEYFEVSELNRIFHAGRNGFLIRGTDFLRRGSTVDIEIVDRFGTPIFLTPVSGYSEGGSRLVSVEIFQRAERGPGKLILVGEATHYSDGRPVPTQWAGKKNVRWVVPIQIEPSNENRTRIRLANSPIVEVSEKNFDITRTDVITTTVSDYTASLTYDYEVHESDGYAIEMLSSSGEPMTFFDDVNIDGVFTGSIYRRKLTKYYDSGVEVPSSGSVLENIVSASVSLSLDKILNDHVAITNNVIQFNSEDFPTTNLTSGSFVYIKDVADIGNGQQIITLDEYTSSVVFQYASESVTSTASTSSIINFRIPFVQTHTGEISKVKIFAKEANDAIAGYQPFAEFTPGEQNFLVQSTDIGDQPIGRFLSNDILQNNWHAGQFSINGTFNRTDYESTESINYPLTVITSSTGILEGARVDNTSSLDTYFFGTVTPIQLYEQVEYTLKYTAVYTPTYVSESTTFNSQTVGSLDVFLTRTGADSASRAESAVISTTDSPYGLQVDEVDTKTTDKSLYERRVNFKVPKTGLAHLRFVSTAGFWTFGDIEITPAVENGFNPDEIIFDAENNFLVSSTNRFKIQFYNWNDEPIDYQLVTSPVFVSGARDPGLDGFTISLSNENISFPASTDGTVLSYEGGGTDIEVFNGATPLNATITTPLDGYFSASIVSSSNITATEPPTVLGTVLRYGDPSGMPAAVDSASITYKISAAFANNSYSFIKKQSFTKAKSGNSGSDGTSPVLFSLTPTSQTVAAGSDGSVPGTFQDVVISGSQGQTVLTYNQTATLGNGEYKITNVTGVTVIDTTPATQIVQISAAPLDTNFCEVFIEYKTLDGTSGTTSLYFTVTKSRSGNDGLDGTGGNGVSIFVSPASQVVSQSALSGLFEDPATVYVTVVEQSTTLTYDDTSPYGNSTFRIIDVVNATNNNNGSVTPDTPVSVGSKLVTFGVSYVDSNGNGTIVPVSHSITTVLEGTTGPGIVFTGEWDPTRTYQYSLSNGRRDAVLYTGSGGPEIDGYYATLATTYVGAEPSTSVDTVYWEYLGDEDYFVAAKISIFEESFIKNTLNIGTNDTGSLAWANITLWGGDNYPYLSLGQQGGQSYASGGVWLGRDFNDGNFKFSISGSNGGTGSGIFFDGDSFGISGSINAQGGLFSGTVSVGDKVFIGPDATTNASAASVVSGFPKSDVENITYLSGPASEYNFTGITLPSTAYQLSSPVENTLYKIDINLDDINTDWYIDGGAGALTASNATTLNSIKLIFVQGSTILKTETIATTWNSGDPLPSKTTYITPTSSLDIDIRIVYTGSVFTEDLDDFSPSTQGLFTASVTASTVDSSIAIRGNGIFIDQGSGPVNIIELLNTGSIGGSSTIPTLQQVTSVGSSTSNAINIINATQSTSKTTGALIVSGGLGVGGDAYANDWIATSDIRSKNVLGDDTRGLEYVLRMNPIIYTRKGESKHKVLTGFSAQEMLNIIPEVVHGTDADYYGISYGSLVPILVNAIKDLKRQLDEIKESTPSIE